MSDLRAGGTGLSTAGPSRSQNASSRTVPATAASGGGQTQIRPPTAVMRDRRKRMAEREAAQKKIEEENRRQQSENDVGVVDDRRQLVGRTPLTEIQPGPTPGTTSVTIGTRKRSENIPTTNGSVPRTGATTNPNQPRPISTQQAQTTDQTSNTQINKNRTEAFEMLTKQATAGPEPQQSQRIAYVPQGTATAVQPPPVRAPFPHAFERWETLSSHWEGLTAYWIRKLDSNKEELNGKPLDQQMARQVTDLSAAGANLFHAVVELQRLRASSERKFQRWFFETRDEQERTRERIAELEHQLSNERQNGSSNNASIEAVRAEKRKADDLVQEMKRELQISKEEARRAWEELGRREQEERERTIALRSGEPTLIGGVQVVPMAGLSSRQFTSTSRPQTRGGPIPGGPGPTQMSGQQRQPGPGEAFSRSQTTLESPEREQEQFSYQPGQTSPTETDPFTESSRTREPPPSQQLRHEPDTQFYNSPPSQRSGGVASAAARSHASPTRGPSQSTSPSRFYHGSGTSGSGYQPMTTTAASQRPVTAGSDNRSYIPSTSGHGSEEEYHMNPDGSYTRDAQGRRIPSDQPISGPGVDPDVYEDDDDDDHTADVERERMYAQQYAQRHAASSTSHTPQGSRTNLPPTSIAPAHHSTTLPTTHNPLSPGAQSYSSTISASSQPAGLSTSQPVSPDYDGSGYGTITHSRDNEIPENLVTGWEGIQAAPRHHHPSRLSAIEEERSRGTSPSRISYLSEGNPTVQRQQGGYNHNNNNNNGGGASTIRRISPD